MGAPVVPRALHTEAHRAVARDARGDRLQTADHRAGGDGDSWREHLGRPEYAPRAAHDQDRRPQTGGRTSVPVRHDERVPDSIRPERSGRAAEGRRYGRGSRLRAAGAAGRADAARREPAARRTRRRGERNTPDRAERLGALTKPSTTE